MHFFLTNGCNPHKKVSNRKNTILAMHSEGLFPCKSIIIFIFYGSYPNICGDLAG